MGKRKENTEALFIFLHSPLVGPTTWLSVAEQMIANGRQAIIPSFLPALTKGGLFSQALALHAAHVLADLPLDQPLIFVAHSAAGAFVPVIRSALRQPAAGYVFVDARLPQNGITLFDDMDADSVAELRGKAADGYLPPWPTWFGVEVMAEVLPDTAVRERFVAECPPIPLALFSEAIPGFANWPDAPCSYLRLSHFYISQTEYARSAGWPVRELEAAHLHMLVEPTAVTEMILQLAQEMEKKT